MTKLRFSVFTYAAVGNFFISKKKKLSSLNTRLYVGCRGSSVEIQDVYKALARSVEQVNCGMLC